MRFAAEVRTIGGGLQTLFGTSSSAALDCVAGAFVSILDVRRGAKKFLVATFGVAGTAPSTYKPS
jgi:hypothetical protein